MSFLNFMTLKRLKSGMCLSHIKQGQKKASTPKENKLTSSLPVPVLEGRPAVSLFGSGTNRGKKNVYVEQNVSCISTLGHFPPSPGSWHGQQQQAKSRERGRADEGFDGHAVLCI